MASTGNGPGRNVWMSDRGQWRLPWCDHRTIKRCIFQNNIADLCRYNSWSKICPYVKFKCAQI